MLEFRALGALEVVGENGPIRLGGPRQRATLAILLLSANRVVPVERLADELYAGRPPVSAVTQVQRQVSELRRALGSADVIETRPPGYLLRVREEGFDLARFERLTAEAGGASDQPERSSALLREALALWRGPPLADLAHEAFALAAVERLDELRLAALEERIEADLRLGRHAAVVAELETLVAAEPFRERFRAQLMLALYRSGRQPDALQVYRDTRRVLVDGFGLEPSAALKELERAILSQAASLDPARPATPVRTGSVVVAPSRDDRVGVLVRLAEPLARDRELIFARIVDSEHELPGASAALRSLGVAVRTAAFTSDDAAADLVRLATTNDADLILADMPPGTDGPRLPDGVAALLERAPAHVALAAGGEPGGEAVYVPFGGGEHDWAALELGAWLASARGAPLRLLGTSADPRTGRRDASRLLADASLAVQRLVEVDASPVLAQPDERSLVEAVAEAALVATGISPRWRHEGIGDARRALVRIALPPVLLLHRGPRPGGLAPRESRTRFTWTIDA